MALTVIIALAIAFLLPALVLLLLRRLVKYNAINIMIIDSLCMVCLFFL